MVFISISPFIHLLEKQTQSDTHSFKVTFFLLKLGRSKIVKTSIKLNTCLVIKNSNMLLHALLIITLKQLHQQSTCKNFFFISSKIFCLHLQNTSYDIQRTNESQIIYLKYRGKTVK